ncbi:MAG: hypothetical protein MJA30_20280 [Cytophagales bacterium]|nr:hypothetical protein [Cytophagales bacterium]
MKKSLVHKLCCPIDKSELDLQIFKQDEQGEITDGLFTCTHCKRYYPIIYGLPIMTPDEYREKSLEAPILQHWGLNPSPAEQKFLLEKNNS